MEGQNAQGQAAPGHMDWPGFANAMGQAIAANLHNLQEPGQQDPAQRAQQALHKARESKAFGMRKSIRAAGTYDTGKNFKTFRTQFFNWLEVNGCQDRLGGQEDQPRVMDAGTIANHLLLCLVGSAGERAKQISRGSDTWNTTILDAEQPDEWRRWLAYFEACQNLFLPIEESAMQKQVFLERVQLQHEDVSSYAGDKLSLYHASYTEAQRNQNFDFLQEKFIQGIYNPQIRKRLVQEDPRTEEALRTSVVRLVAQERRLFNVYHASDATSLDGCKATAQATYGSMLPDQSMELNQINEINRMGGEQIICRRCHKPGHMIKDCVVPAARLPGGQGGRTAGPAKSASSNKKDNKDADLICNHCGIKGHRWRDCRKRQRGEPKAKTGQGGSKGKARSRVNTNRKSKPAGSHKQIDEDAEDTEVDGFLAEGEESDE